MKTRTLLQLSVGTALAILIAGGVLLFQLSSEQDTVEPTALGERVTVGDVEITVLAAGDDGTDFVVDVELGGVDDLDGLDDIRLITGDLQLAPIAAPAEGRCATLTVEVQRCSLAFDTSATGSSSRVLVMRRGDQQRNWNLGS